MLYGKDYQKQLESELSPLFNQGIDGIMMETFIVEDDVYTSIEAMGEVLGALEEKLEEKPIQRFDEKDDHQVRDYIIYNAIRSARELGVRAVICFTETGYTASRFSSLTPNIPVITFTQSTDTYRYLSLVRGVKGYKISQSFNYENLKRIGKEMIRIIFKGNISLDDKILILQANERI